MTGVIYKGKADVRVLAAKDLQKAGVDGDFRQTTFRQNETVDVDSAVATALVERSDLFGDFALASSEEQAAEAPASTDQPAVLVSEDEAKGKKSSK